MITRTLVSNGLLGIIFGWLYWKRGLEAAMISHFSADIVLHVLLALWEFKMAEEIKQWEYRVQTIGSVFGTKDEQIQATLNEWGAEGWEAINVYTPYGSGKITIVAKRPFTERARRLRSWPSQ